MELRRDAEVAIRGWNLPHIDRDHGDTRFQDGIQSWTNVDRCVEAHRAYRSGLFVWRRLLWENLDDDLPEGVLSYVSSIWSVTEQLLFAARWATDVSTTETAVVDWQITGLRDRTLWVEPGIGVRFSQRYRCFEEFLTRSVALPSPELKVGWEDLTLDWLSELFELFQAEIARQTLRDWQTKFLERRF
jgi:hypothetical protein